jgi:hypothetical protein
LEDSCQSWHGSQTVRFVLPADDQFWETQFESLIEQFGMLLFPTGHGTVKGIENATDLFQGRLGEAAAVFPVEVLYLRAGNLHVCHTATSVQPKFLPFGGFAWRLDRRVWRVIPYGRVFTASFRRRDAKDLGVTLARHELRLSNRFVGHVHKTIDERLQAY